MGISKNYCKTNGPISSCTAKNWEEQKQCDSYEKARQHNRCMYFIFDEYCDCLKAQMKVEKVDGFSEGVK